MGNPLITGTELTVEIADELDRDDDLEIAFDKCGLGEDTQRYERYFDVEQVEAIIEHLQGVLKRHKAKQEAK